MEKGAKYLPPQKPQVYIHSARFEPPQCRWLELVKDYDLGINYHPGKANMVADALSRKPVILNTIMESLPPELQEEVAQLNLVIVDAGLANILEVTPTLEVEIRKAQPADIKLQKCDKSPITQKSGS